MKIFIRFIFLQLLLLSLAISVFAQSKRIPDAVQYQIDNYKNNAIKNRNVGDDNSAAMYLNKIGFLYWEYFVYDESVRYFEEVLKVYMDIGNVNGQKKVLDNLAFVYSDMERYDKAIQYFLKGYSLYEAEGNKSNIASSLNNLALAYNNNGQAKEAISYAEKGLAISQAANNIKLMRSFYGILYESYEKLGNKDKSTEYFGLYSSIDKHIQQQNFQAREQQSKLQLSQMKSEKDQAVTQKEKKEKELRYTQDTLKQNQLALELSNAENEAKEARIKAKEVQLKAERRLVYFLVALFVLILIFAYYVYMQMRQKKRANEKLQELYSEIEKKNIQILDSINYASHIQEAILPYKQSINEEINQSFIFYKPKDIVSGDFYWYAKHNDKIFIAAIDCTGHGVPGAFMSMIGNTLLNEIVNERKVWNPAEVLHLLNEKVVFTLNQDNKDQQGFSEDGMDITFCTYDKKNNKVELALANHSATIFQNNKQRIIEGDIFSIGGNVGNFDVKFTNHTIDITEETTLYLYSDGFQDQFGGMKNQKFMAGRFTKLLSKMQTLNFDQQFNYIETEFIQWKGEGKQVDDILVIGLKLIPQ